jgi:hypothetical protein
VREETERWCSLAFSLGDFFWLISPAAGTTNHLGAANLLPVHVLKTSKSAPQRATNWATSHPKLSYGTSNPSELHRRYLSELRRTLCRLSFSVCTVFIVGNQLKQPFLYCTTTKPIFKQNSSIFIQDRYRQVGYWRLPGVFNIAKHTKPELTPNLLNGLNLWFGMLVKDAYDNPQNYQSFQTQCTKRVIF